MNIAEKISHVLHRNKKTSNHIDIDGITRRNFLRLGGGLLSTGFLAACNDTVGGSGGQPRQPVDQSKTFQGYYCQIDINQNQYTGSCNWIADDGNDCPEEYIDQHVVTGNIHWRLQRAKDQYGNEYRKCSVTTKQN